MRLVVRRRHGADHEARHGDQRRDGEDRGGRGRGAFAAAVPAQPEGNVGAPWVREGDVTGAGYVPVRSAWGMKPTEHDGGQDDHQARGAT